MPHVDVYQFNKLYSYSPCKTIFSSITSNPLTLHGGKSMFVKDYIVETANKAFVFA